MAEAILTARALEALLGDWRGGDPAVYRALAERVRLLVLDGRIPTATRLPAERELAERLGLSRTSVTAAYRELRDRGFVHSVRGSGSAVRIPGTAAAPAPHAEPGTIDFGKASPPALPWLADVAAESAAELPAHLGTSGYEPLGLPVLREAIARRYTARGLPTSPDEILVTIGAQHAIALLARTLIGRGDRALIEAPTYPHAYEALRTAGARLVAVAAAPHDEAPADEGAELARAIRHSNPVAAYLMPDFHNPTGRSLDDAARSVVVDAAERSGTVLIADETTAELDIDRAGGPFAPLAAHGPAVLIGSLGKIAWGGLRIGWIRAEPALIRRLLGVRAPGDLGTPVLEQLIAARLVDRQDEAVELRRVQLSAGRALLETLLAESFPEWRVPHVDGGLAAWIDLGAPVSSQLALAARARGLVVPAGPRFGIDGAFERRLRLPICYSADETRAAVRVLELAWASLGSVASAEAGYAAVV